MEENINIAEILKDKKNGLRLYSPIFGKCTFCCVHEDTNDICVKIHNGVKEFFDSKGLYYNTGEVMLFPSKEMRDWSKFFKKGDVLFYIDGSKCNVIFDKFDDDKYTSFIGKHYLESYGKDGELQDYEEIHFGSTVKYTKESEEAAQTYISTIEERLGGKLNRETLVVEKTHTEFKDGDIVTIINGCEQRCILIFRNIIGDSLNRYCILTKRGLFTEGYSLIDKEDSLLFATEEEKNKLFSALEKEGKAWDSEKKQIVDLKPKVEFKPMDLCLMKYIGQYNNRGWELCQYAYTEHRVSSSGEQRDFYHAVGGEIYAECIPYNEDTKHLLGTRDKWKGGEV